MPVWVQKYGCKNNIPPDNISSRLSNLTGADGGIVTNANDMAKWLLLHLNKGTNQHGDIVVKESVLNETYQPVNIYKSPFPFKRPTLPVTLSLETYALGLFTGYYRGRYF